ncbi:MAG: hemin-degrading factor [Thermaurantiacus sp.]
MASLAETAPPTDHQPPRAPLRPVDAAAALGVSEAEWLVGHAPGPVVPLAPPFGPLVEQLTSLGPVMALTRNPSCVHEKDGIYDHVEIGRVMGLVLNHAIDLRLFMNHWTFGFAVETPLETGGVRRSLQFFDRSGTAVHKIFARPATDMAAFDALVARFRHPSPPAGLETRPYPPAAPDRPDAEIDVGALRGAWDDLRDVHDFFALLRKAGAGRQQALRLAGPPFARPVAPSAVADVFHAAARNAVPIMVFVGNRGCIQIHSGPIHRVQPMGPWLNILDPGFNLHLRADHVANAWAVWKPQSDSAVHSLELFDAEGQLIAQIFGERKPGIPEREDWQALVADIPTLGARG